MPLDVLLIQPPIRDFYLTAGRTVPYGLLCVAAALQQQGLSVKIVDALSKRRARPAELPPELAYLRPFYEPKDLAPFALFSEYKHFGHSVEHLGVIARAEAPFVVGISASFSTYAEQALDTARAVRRFCPQAVIVLGGHHATQLPERVLACAAVDYVIRGEGEVALPALVRALRGGGALADVPGLGYRRADGAFAIGGPAFQAALDENPLPAAQLRPERERASGRAVVVTSRGCPLHCRYCAVATPQGAQCSAALPHRRRSVASVLAELERLIVDDGARFIDFEDENLALDKPWLLALLEHLSARFAGYPLELRAMNGLLPSTVDGEVVAAMARAGFATLNLSLGASQGSTLRRFGRPNMIAAFDRALALCEHYGLDAVGYIIIGGPEQPWRDSLADLRFLAERRVLAGLSVYYPAPGSEDFRRYHGTPLFPDAPSCWRSSALPIDGRPEHGHPTRLETATLLRLGRLLNFIKAELDRGAGLPVAEPLGVTHIEPDLDRRELGRRLLAAFLHDSVLRGVTVTGEIFEQRALRPLAEGFCELLHTGRLRGVRR